MSARSDGDLAADAIHKLNSTNGALATLPIELDNDIDHRSGVIHGFLTSKAKPGLHAHEGDLFERPVG